ncbi:rCG46886 [Rattus norvegicus]|uniref:RCG46886 n=1 Tax=Rattus norvegicus TaxID=10116 RepID=A6IWX3_RAT|nr:rCG46886 [Rattus norvegicus]
MHSYAHIKACLYILAITVFRKVRCFFNYVQPKMLMFCMDHKCSIL